jgi:hypothetical protein
LGNECYNAAKLIGLAFPRYRIKFISMRLWKRTMEETARMR